MCIADSGATSHFLTIDAPIVNKKIARRPLAITTAGGAVIYSSHTGELALPFLPIAARRCHVVPSLGNFSLLSIGQLCDANCDVIFSKEKITVDFQGTVIMRGRRALSTGLWHLDLVHHDGVKNLRRVPVSARQDEGVSCQEVAGSSPSIASPYTPTCQAALGTSSPANLVAFHHAALFSPTLSTLELALKKGFLPPFPGLTLQALHRHPPHSVASIKGHLD